MKQLADHDPGKWHYRVHTGIKHRILASYLPVWLNILGHAHRTLFYVDAFAGRGQYQDGQQGSPLLALDAAVTALNHASSLHVKLVCHFIEANARNCELLGRELTHHPATQDPRIQWVLHQDTFEGIIPTIINDVHMASAPSFFFVDPFGCNDVPMALVGDIFSLPKSEVFVNFMYNGMTRLLGAHRNSNNADTLTRQWGGDDWRNLVSMQKPRQEREALHLYMAQMKRNGAKFVIPFRMGSDTSARTLYYLLHGTKNIKGAEIMKRAMVASASPGRLGFAGEAAHLMTPMFRFDIDELPEYLLQEFKGRTVSVREVVAATIERTGVCLPPDYNACLKEMERVGKITIERVDSAKSGLKPSDLVHFRPRADGVQIPLFEDCGQFIPSSTI